MSGSLTLTIGLPGSGKSTWASQAGADLVIERDTLREELTGDRRNHTQEALVTAVQQRRVRQALAEGKHVIVSDTNLKEKYRRQWRKMAEECGALYAETSFLEVPIEVCIERDAARERPVGEEVIRRMAQGLVK